MAPFGYVKHPEIKNKLMVDKETAWVIRKIFDLSLHGMGASKIVKTLMAEQLPCPGWVQYAHSGACARFFVGQPEEKKFAWSPTQVKNVLKDETYIGNTVHHRQGTVSYKNKGWFAARRRSGFVLRELTRLSSPKRFLKCADCGWSMWYSLRSNVKETDAFFNCGSYRDYHRINGKCSLHYIRCDTLYAYVLARIQHWSAQAQRDDDVLLTQLLDAGSREWSAAKKKQVAKLKKAEKRRTEVDGLFARLYEDWMAGRITESNFEYTHRQISDRVERVGGED